LIPAVLIDAPDQSAARPEAPAILVELPGGVRVRVMASAPAALVTAALRALR
jgi:hypothetical protein